MSNQERLVNSENRYDELNMLLADPQVISDRQRYLQLVQEHSTLEPLVLDLRRKREVVAELEENKIMLVESSEQEFRELIREEISSLEAELEDLVAKIEYAIAPRDPLDDKNVIMEIRAGAGGDEAALFAADLYRMYIADAESQNYRHDLIDLSENGLGGYKEVVFEIDGKGAYSRYKFESGVHRVQRVPVTESGGRIHTSTVTVAVLAAAEDVDIEINPADLEIDTYRASGAGGQHVNKTSSAIRITHVPTGVVVTCQDQRSQHKNKDKAMAVLRARLLESEQFKQASEISSERKSQVGTGDRSERIRTYNYPQSRVSDHRINLTLYQLDQVLAGELDLLIKPLAANHYEQMIAANDSVN